MATETLEADAVVVGSGLAGLVATAELTAAGRRVVLLEQEPEASIGGQAFWSLGGLFLVDTPEQRRWGVRDSLELAWQDWEGAATFDRPEDHWPRRWARAYVEWAAGEKRDWLHAMGVRFMPNPGWAERGGYGALGHGNSVPRFHLTWGTGPGVLEPFLKQLSAARARGLVTVACRHRVDELIVEAGAVVGARGAVLQPSGVPRGASSSREAVGDFEARAPAVLVASGGIGGNLEMVRDAWPTRLGAPPRELISGVPAHVDGRMLRIATDAGGRVIGADRMWHYTEGVANWSPIWPAHGIRILPAPSSLWLDATGVRLPVPLFPGFDTLGTLAEIGRLGHDHTWFVLTKKIIEREFALSGSEQNPDITGRSIRAVLRERVAPGVPSPVQAFMDQGEDFAVASDLGTLVEKMNAITGGRPELPLEQVRAEVEARDREMGNPFSKDSQVTAIHGARRYRADRISRVAAPHRLLDPEAGPLVAVRLRVLTRKTLGGLETDLSGRALDGAGAIVPGLWAAGEAAGFGGGGMHGYRSLEGTFLGGCLFSGRSAGRAIVDAGS